MKTMVFIHGWPDDQNIWTEQINEFAKTYNCKTLQLPGFGEKEESLDFPQMTERLVADIRKFSEPVILVGHDWGAYFAYLIEKKHPELIEKIITLDVGAEIAPESFKDGLILVGYQWTLISAWKIRKLLPAFSDKVSLAIAKFAKIPHPEKVSSQKNFIYYFFWRDLLFKKENLLGKYRPKCPLLYIYADKKLVMFHSAKWLKKIMDDPKNKVVAFPSSQHWFMIRKSEATNKIIREWLNG